MNTNLTKINKFMLALSCLITFSCSAQGMTFKEAANQYCELYSPDAWSHLSEDPDLHEVYTFITNESRNISNPKLLEAVDNADTSNFSSFFSSVRANIESHLGEEWQCVHFDNFFFPKQKIIPITIGNMYEKHVDPNASNALVITLLASGVIIVDNSPLHSPTPENISKAIGLVLKDKDSTSTAVYIYFDEGADGTRISEILMLLDSFGVRSLGLIHYSS